ncbi:MAG: hypothetical protein HRU78_09350 [Gammaproteobacteria bacterium]|nr:MAG: hypothetical protein HRU78_09350 [Gammaproteobacteria bacterium]
MFQTRILADSLDVNLRLETLGITKQELVTIAISAATARNDAVSIDPINAPGQLSYIFGTRAIRLALLPKGWVLDRTDNIEATFNKELNIKIIFQNVESACSKQPPKAISSKGDATKRLVANNSLYLWPEMEHEFNAQENTSVWFLCVSTKNDEIRAELSRPHSIEGNQFGEFIERIFILTDNNWNPINHIEDTSNLNNQEFDIQVTRK